MLQDEVIIIVLNYNGWQDTVSCLRSTQNIRYPHKLLVIDNGSTDDSVEEIKKQCDMDVKVIATGMNLGYAGGNNVGIKYALENQYKYCCVLNNDTIIEEDFMEACIRHLNNNPGTAFVGPTILDYHSGRIQSTGGNIFINKGEVDCKNQGKKLEEVSEIIESDYLGGACMVFKSDLIEQIGYIPESYFLFFEETEWCWKALKKGFENICLGTNGILHKGSVSINKLEGLHEYLMMRNQIAFIRRNHPNKLKALWIYCYKCLKVVREAIKNGPQRLRRIVWFTHGWFKMVDKDKYPFIVIKE